MAGLLSGVSTLLTSDAESALKTAGADLNLITKSVTAGANKIESTISTTANNTLHTITGAV